jgi:hypothetical protein
MEEVFIVAPCSVGLSDIAAVLGRTWTLDDELSIPYVNVDPHSSAYVDEEDQDEDFKEGLFLDHPELPEILARQFGDDYKIFALRYRDPALAREMTRALATSELAASPMLLNADGSYLPAGRFLERLAEDPPWDWFEPSTSA